MEFSWELLYEREKLLVYHGPRALLEDPSFIAQLKQVQEEHERSVILQRESQKLRIENLGEELAALVQGTSDEPDFLSPWVKEEPARCKIRMWARLPGLELKYWGLECIGRIMSGIGRVVEADIGTACRNGFRFARVLMEVERGQKCPEFVGFEGEEGEEIVQRIEYEEGRGLVIE